MRRGPNPPLKPKVLTRALVGLLLTLYSERSEASWGPQTHSLYGSGFGDAAPSFAEPRGGPTKSGVACPSGYPPHSAAFFIWVRGFTLRPLRFAACEVPPSYLSPSFAELTLPRRVLHPWRALATQERGGGTPPRRIPPPPPPLSHTQCEGRERGGGGP